MKKLWPYLLFWCCGTPFFAAAQAIRPPVSPSQPGSLPISPASALPIRATITPAPATTLTMVNDSISRNYTGITLDWQLLVNGQPRQKGAVPGLQLVPGRPRTLRLPLKAPAAGEAWLKLDYRGPSRPSGPGSSPADSQPASAIRSKLATPFRPAPVSQSQPALSTQFLPWQPWNADLSVPVAGELSFTDSNNVFTINSPTLRAAFDKETGWMRELTVDNYPLVTDTDGIRLTLPSLPHLQLFSTSTGSRMVIVRTEYTLPDPSWLLHLSYTFNSAGTLLVEETLEKDTTRPDSLIHPLGRIGMKLVLPHDIDSVSWFGLAAEDPTNNDRAIRDAPTATNATAAIHHAPTAATDTIPSIHRLLLTAGSAATAVRWWSARDNNGRGLQLTADSNLIGSVTGDAGAPIVYLQAPDDASSPIAPARHHFAFKLTPLSPITLRPAPTHSAPVHPAPSRPAPIHPAPTSPAATQPSSTPPAATKTPPHR